TLATSRNNGSDRSSAPWARSRAAGTWAAAAGTPAILPLSGKPLTNRVSCVSDTATGRVQTVDIWTFKEKDATELCKTSRFYRTRLSTHRHRPANTVCECGTRRHCGASEAAQQPAQQRAEILKSLGETSSLSDGLRNFMGPAPDTHCPSI